MATFKSGDDWVKSLLNDLDEIEDGKPLRIAAATTHAISMQRIFVEGKDSTGGIIGVYSTDPTYINPKESPRKFSPKGKNGKGTFKNGKRKKTRYFGGGYKQYKGVIGRDNSKVNLINFGQLQSDLANSLTRKGKSYETGTRRKENTDKLVGNSVKFTGRSNGISNLTEQEVQIFVDTFDFEVDKLR